MITTIAIATAITLRVLESHIVSANSIAVALPDAVAAARMLCPVPVPERSRTVQLAQDLQSATTGPVLTCSKVSRSAFLDAIALPQPSGYPGDASVLPALVIQPAGT